MSQLMSDPRRDPEALGKAFERGVYRPPTKRRLQLEAWGIFLTFLIVSWCFVGGVVLGIQTLLTLANALLH